MNPKYSIWGIACLFLMFLPDQAGAQESGTSSVKDIGNCVQIQSDKDRLACYDKAAGRLTQAVASGAIVVIDKATVQDAKKEGFGLNLPTLSGIGKIFKSDGAKDLPDDKDQIQVEIKSIVPVGYKKNRFYLENGQVWDQVQSSNYRAPKRKDDAPYFVVISKAPLGSFNLRINNKGKKIKVKRVK